MPTPETDILKTVDSSLANSDDWAIFVLHNAQVVHEGNGMAASLLAAYADMPLRVTGTFTPARGQAKYLLEKCPKPIELEIRNVTRFSYGELTDGEFAIWAEGNAGWFEIRPAPQYKRIYEDMIEAVQLLYFVTDIYNEPRKRGGGPSAQLVYQEYAEDERFACTDAAVAAEIFQKHRVFLFMCFLNRAQGISWSNTPIYQYFRRQYPKDFEVCKARLEGRYDAIPPDSLTAASKSPLPSAAQPASGSKRANSVQEKTAVAKTDVAPKKDDNWWEAAALFEFMQKAVNQRVLRAGRNQITLERIAQLIVRRYEIEEQAIAQNVLLVHAKNLCYMMDHPRRKTARFFADEPIYRELAAGHNLSAAEQRRSEGVELKPRRDHATLRDNESESSDTSSEGEDVMTTPARRPYDRRKKGRLSVLRPTNSKYSGKSKGLGHKQGGTGKGKAPLPTMEISEASDAEETGERATDSDEEMAIDTPTQALSPSREKRKLNDATEEEDDDDDDDDDDKTPRRKRATSTSQSFNSPPTTLSPSPSDEEPHMLDGTAVPPLPLRHQPNPHAKSDIAPSLIATPLPTYEPNGPRNSWICSFDGCSQRIYGCHKELGRRLITEHLEDHEKGREKVVGILWREQDKLQLPVNNLIKKIRKLSEASAPPLFPVSDPIHQKPIHRPV